MAKPPVPKRPRPCGTCGGSGTITTWTTDRKGKQIKYDKTCGTCRGSGETTAT